MLINVKMLTIVGILTFISMINTTSERIKARNFRICGYFSFYEQLKFRAQLSWHEKSCITSRPGYVQAQYDGPLGFWGSGENGYLFSGSWGALVIILGELGSKLIILGI